jgi:predicted ester cyclase
MAATAQENAALVRRFLTNVVGGGDTESVSIFLADDVVNHHHVFGNGRGQEAVLGLGWRVLAAADIDVEIAEVVANEERVAVRGTVSGSHCESLMDLAPTGASFEIAHVWFCGLDNGRITEIHSFPDGLGLMQQLGAIPERTRKRTPTQPNESQRQ